MAEMTIDREGIVFCSDYHNFYAYKNLRKRMELLLYKYYKKGANNWILLSRDGDISMTYTYSFSLDFTTHISDGAVIKGEYLLYLRTIFISSSVLFGFAKSFLNFKPVFNFDTTL